MAQTQTLKLTGAPEAPTNAHVSVVPSTGASGGGSGGGRYGSGNDNAVGGGAGGGRGSDCTRISAVVIQGASTAGTPSCAEAAEADLSKAVSSTTTAAAFSLSSASRTISICTRRIFASYEAVARYTASTPPVATAAWLAARAPTTRKMSVSKSASTPEQTTRITRQSRYSCPAPGERGGGGGGKKAIVDRPPI
jgi:hypothetical protein